MSSTSSHSMESTPTHFERGGEYFFLITERSSDPDQPKSTEIHHPSSSLRLIETGIHLSSNNSVRRRTKVYNPPRKKVHFSVGVRDVATLSRNLGTGQRQRPLSTYLSQNSLERSLSDMSAITDTDNEEEPIQNRRMDGKLDAGIIPFNVKIKPGESPYRRPQHMSLYGGKPPQTWFYDQQTNSIPEPPKIPKGISVPLKALYICDTMNDTQCTKRQIWINEGERGVFWSVVEEASDAQQVIDNKVYVCYICDKGPRWVKRASYVTYRGRKAHRDG